MEPLRREIVWSVVLSAGRRYNAAFALINISIRNYHKQKKNECEIAKTTKFVEQTNHTMKTLQR